MNHYCLLSICKEESKSNRFEGMSFDKKINCLLSEESCVKTNLCYVTDLGNE